MTLAGLFHDAARFLALEPEDVAAVLMEAAQARRAGQRPHWPAFLLPAMPYAEYSNAAPVDWPFSLKLEVEHALAEAIAWLTQNGLVMTALPNTPVGPGKLVFTRRGLQLRTKADIARYREASALPTALVHHAIAERVIPQFLRGDRDSAVSYAFREVEIAVRSAAGYDDAKHGMSMMREAFNPKNNGPLVDPTLPPGEQEGEQALFAGAIAHGRNPVSHRDVDMTPAEAARLILLASHLLTIVEKRIAAKRDGGST